MSTRGPLPAGKMRRVFDIAEAASGTQTRVVQLDADTADVALWVDAGTATVDVYAKADDGKTKLLDSFTIGSTTDLVVRRQDPTLDRLEIVVTWTGALTASLWVRGLMLADPDNAVVDSGNSSTTPLGAGGVYTGDWVDVAGFVTASVTVNSDAPSVTDGWQIQLSTDGVNVDTEDIYTFLAAGTGEVITLGLTARYLRVVYTNDTTPQTFFRLQTCLFHASPKPSSHRIGDNIDSENDAELVKAVLTGPDRDGVFRNVNTTRTGDLSTSISDPDLGVLTQVTPLGALRTVQHANLIGDSLPGQPLSTNKWSTVAVGSGVVSTAVPGEISLDTGVTANSSISIQTTDVARFLPANFNVMHAAAQLSELDGTDNIREWGAMDPQNVSGNGALFRYDATGWHVVIRNTGVDTVIDQADWNGAGAAAFVSNTNAHVYEIIYNAGQALFYQDGNLIHRESNLATPLFGDIHLRVGASNTNINGSTTERGLQMRAIGTFVFGTGRQLAHPTFIVGVGTTVIKNGPGTLSRVIISRSGSAGGNATVDIYDAITATNQIGQLIIGGDGTAGETFEATFNTGLTIVVSSAGGIVGTTVIWD